jgi:hypothetical protein
MKAGIQRSCFGRIQFRHSDDLHLVCLLSVYQSVPGFSDHLIHCLHHFEYLAGMSLLKRVDDLEVHCCQLFTELSSQLGGKIRLLRKIFILF